MLNSQKIESSILSQKGRFIDVQETINLSYTLIERK